MSLKIALCSTADCPFVDALLFLGFLNGLTGWRNEELGARGLSGVLLAALRFVVATAALFALDRDGAAFAFVGVELDSAGYADGCDGFHLE